MTNRDLLKEAIADAKAVKETAIANAKAALEESFGPFLQQTLAAKLMEIDEMDGKDTEEIDEMVDKDELEEYAEKQPKSKEEAHEIPATKEAKEMEEETMDLEELLRELDEMSNEEDLNEVTNDPRKSTSHGNVEEANEIDMTVDADSDGIPDEMDDDINIEEMSTEDLESFIKDVIASMVKDGELEAGHEDMKGEEKDEEGKEGKEDEEEIDVDELVAEIRRQKAKDSEKEIEEEKMAKMEKELKEAYDALKTIKVELNEVNLFNAKLLYTNKIFRAKNLSENQKVKVLAAFDKATSINEAKLVFETLNEGLNQQTKTPVNESLLRGAASKVAGVAPKKPIMEVNEQFSRWQLLAGIKNN